MGRAIDADALHEALKTKQKWVVRCGDKHNEGYTYDQVHFAIDESPTIDAVEVVRCYECKHKIYCYSEVAMTNKSQTADIYKSVNFCSYGVRETDHE